MLVGYFFMFIVESKVYLVVLFVWVWCLFVDFEYYFDWYFFVLLMGLVVVGIEIGYKYCM